MLTILTRSFIRRKIVLLFVYNQRKEYYLSEIARRVKTTPGTAQRELNKLLDALPMDACHRKRRTTVLRLAEAAATGQTEKSVFAQPDTCGWKAWDGQYRKDAEGNSYKEIAAALKISPKTVGQHRDRLMQKLHCRRTAELVKFALREGLTPVSD